MAQYHYLSANAMSLSRMSEATDSIYQPEAQLEAQPETQQVAGVPSPLFPTIIGCGKTDIHPGVWAHYLLNYQWKDSAPKDVAFARIIHKL